AGVERVAEASAAIDSEALARPEHGVEREDDGDGLDGQIAAHDAVAVVEIADLDLEMQLVVVLVAEGSETAGLEDLVAGELLVDVRAIPPQPARASQERDGPFALFGDRREGRRGGESEQKGEAHCLVKL